MATPKDVKMAREIILANVGAAKRNAMGMLEGGHRNWTDVRDAVEKYIDLQRAADVLDNTEKMSPT
jgi:hypothetical protein